MNRMFRGGLLALPLLLAAGPSASASDLGAGILGLRSGCYQYGCQGFCLNFFPHMTQHGPLVNYGPWGPETWADPWGGNGGCGWGGRACGRHGCGRCGGGLGGLHLFHRAADTGNCGGWGGYARTLFRNVGHRVNPFAGGRPACSTCAQ